MKYCFERVKDRLGTDSMKWDVAEGELAMALGDMDFEAPPEVKLAIAKRAEHGIFGYTDVNNGLFSAVSDFYTRRFSYTPLPEDMIFSTGVVAAISAAVRKLTTPAENVALLTPVYNIFFNCILNNGRVPLCCELKYDGGRYFVDFESLEEILSRPQTSMLIFCNPHNPVGKIWTRAELARIGKLCEKYGVTVVSDEIHAPLTNPDKPPYIPFASVNAVCRDISVSCISASKAFNLAGLHSAVVVASNPTLRHKMWREINTSECGETGCFGALASQVALTECDGWLDELRAYIFENRRIAEEYINKNIPELTALHADATYFLWIDVSKVPGASPEIAAYIRKTTGLVLSSGSIYGPGGEQFLRMNLATSRERVLEGLSRLERGIKLCFE